MSSVAPATGDKSGRLLSRPEVEQLTRLSRSTIYRRIESGDFPRPVRVSVRAVAWWESEVEQWRRSRPDNNAGH